MLAQLRTFALLGIDAVPVDVEVDTSPAQMPKTVMVGLPEPTVRESIHRIERALVNLGYRLPTGRTVVNLAPADLPRMPTRSICLLLWEFSSRRDKSSAIVLPNMLRSGNWPWMAQFVPSPGLCPWRWRLLRGKPSV